jgi:hypothetical protein
MNRRERLHMLFFVSLFVIPAKAHGQCVEMLKQQVMNQRVTPATRKALQSLEPLFAQKVYPQIEKELDAIRSRLTVSGERGTDYYEVQSLLIKNWTRQGRHDKAATAYRMWLKETRSVDVAFDFDRWATANQRIPVFDSAVSDFVKNRLEPDDCLEATLLTIQWIRRLPNNDPKSMEESFKAMASPLRQPECQFTRCYLLNRVGMLTPSTEDPARCLRIGHFVESTLGPDRVDVDFLMKLATWEMYPDPNGSGRRIGSIQRARDYLHRAESLITKDDKRLAVWLIQSARLELDELRDESASSHVDQLESLLTRNADASWARPMLMETIPDLRQEIDRLRDHTGKAHP